MNALNNYCNDHNRRINFCFLRTASLPVYEKLWSSIERHGTMEPNATFAIEKVRNTENYAFLWDSAVLEYEVQREPCNTLTLIERSVCTQIHLKSSGGHFMCWIGAERLIKLTFKQKWLTCVNEIQSHLMEELAVVQSSIYIIPPPPVSWSVLI